MKRLIWLPVAGFLLVAGAAVAVAAPEITSTASSLFNSTMATPGPDATLAPVDDETDESDNSDGTKDGNHRGGMRAALGGLLDEVLADLVSEGVITQQQSDAILAALTTAAEEQRTDMQAELDEMRRSWEQIQGFLEDGVITQEEVNQLPVDSGLRELFDSIAQDGEINLEELGDLGPGFGRGLGPWLDQHLDGRGGPRLPGLFEMPGPASPDSNPDSDSKSDSGTGSS